MLFNWVPGKESRITHVLLNKSYQNYINLKLQHGQYLGTHFFILFLKMQREYSSDFLTFFSSFLLSEFAKFASTHSELFLEKVFLNGR